MCEKLTIYSDGLAMAFGDDIVPVV
jgi:hypothetical protein